jgi:hypothetical protein
MHHGRLIFSQLLDFFPKHESNKCVLRYAGNRRVREFSCFDQFLATAFAQLTGRDSLRDIEICVRAFGPKLYHAGFRGKVSRSTLADANESRDWRIYADFAQVLITTARDLYSGDPFVLELDHTVYALDATVIDLCLSLFPWARFRKHKGAVKMHTLLDLRGNIPTVIHITHGKVHEVNILDDLIFEPGAIYLMDRGYLDFARLHAMTETAVYFVTRSKSNLDFQRVYSHPVDKFTGVQYDQTIRLKGIRTGKSYPSLLRRIRYVDPVTGKQLCFLTNNFLLEALMIAQLFRYRWQIELFFKWIKQHLRLKSFYGTSINAVKTQIWIAVSVYVLVAIIKNGCIWMPVSTQFYRFSVSRFSRIPRFYRHFHLRPCLFRMMTSVTN